jgi:hypothetical protein
MSNSMFSTSALKHVPTSTCAVTPRTGMSAWASQLPIAPNGVVAAAANRNKDARGARAFEDPV